MSPKIGGQGVEEHVWGRLPLPSPVGVLIGKALLA
jgi:hypothetical protein